MAGRRETLRSELLAAVRVAARDQLRQAGPADLSLRAIAREVGISPAGLYRYFDGRDALLTMLITDGYDDLADHLFLARGAADEVSELDRTRRVPHAVGADDDPREQLLATWRTYRGWALDHPNEFHLLFGQPIEGYRAPSGGETVRANARMSRALITPAFLAWAAGGVEVPELVDPPAGLSILAETITAEAPTPVPPAFAALVSSWWSLLHGAVALELNGQFHWLGRDGAADLFETTMQVALRDAVPT